MGKHDDTKIPEFGDKNIESMILSTLLNGAYDERVNCHDIFENIIEDDFIDRVNKNIYKVLKYLYLKNESLDIISVINRYKETYKDHTPSEILQINEVSDTVLGYADVSVYYKKIREYRKRRAVYGLSRNNLHYSQEGDIDELINSTADTLYKISQENNKKGNLVHISDAITLLTDHIEDTVKGSRVILFTNYLGLDRKLNGLKSGNFIVIAARPSIGKTQFALNIALNIAFEGYTVHMYTLEMSNVELTSRIVSIIANDGSEESFMSLINQRQDILKLSTNKILTKIDKAYTVVNGINLYICDRADSDLNLIRQNSKGIGLFNNSKPDLIIFDYIQLMKDDGRRSRQEFISDVSRNFKLLAKELEIPIIALSQLNRSLESREDKRPILSDLRECLSVETSTIFLKNGMTKNTSGPIKLLSLGEKHKIVVKDSINIPKEENTVYRLTTESGRFIDATANHPVLTTDGYKMLGEIKLTDSIALAKNWCKNGHAIDNCRLTGWIIGGVKSYLKTFVFTSTCSEVRDEFVLRLTSLINVNVVKKDVGDKYYAVISKTPENKSFIKLLKNNQIDITSDTTRVIPDWIIKEANFDSIKELMASLFETKGSVRVGDKSEIRLSTKYEGLCQQILYLLAKIGIIAHYNNDYKAMKNGNPICRIIIANRTNINFFKEKIKLMGYNKKKLDSIRARRYNPNNNNVIGLDTSNEIKRKCKAFKIEILNGTKRNSRLYLKTLRKVLRFEEMKEYSWLDSDCIYWDRVDKVEKLGVVDVFDRNVPGTSNFIVNGIIVHNSGAIEQDADIVLGLYRDEFYNKDTDKHGIMEVIINKNRHGSTGSVDLLYAKERGLISDFNGITIEATYK